MKRVHSGLVDKYENVLMAAYVLLNAKLLTRQDASHHIRTENQLSHSALIWTILCDAGIIHMNRGIIEWIGTGPSTDMAEYVVLELRKRNQENIVSLTKRRQLEQQLSTQFPEENAEVVETVKPAPTFKTINLNGSCISVPEGTSLQLDTNGCLTINL